MAKNQHNAGLHYRPLNQLGLSNFNDYIENPIDSRFKLPRQEHRRLRHLYP